MKILSLSYLAVLVTAYWPSMSLATCPQPNLLGPHPEAVTQAGCAPQKTFKLIYVSTNTVTLPGTKLPNWGNTSEEVDSLFITTLSSLVKNNAALDATFSGMDPMMLARFSTEMSRHDSSGTLTLPILEIFASKLSASNLRLLQGAFGPTLMVEAMSAAPPQILAEYDALPPAPPLLYSQYYYATGGKISTTLAEAMDPYDIFLEYYLSGIGGTPTLSMNHAVQYLTATRPNTNGIPWKSIGQKLSSALGLCTSIDPSCVQDLANWANWLGQQIIGGTPTIIQFPPDFVPGGGYPDGDTPDTPVDDSCYDDVP
jgi:hypothetical protein